MKILSVEAKAFKVKLSTNFTGSNYTYTHKKCVFAQAKTDQGIEGFCYLGDDFGLGRKIAKMINEDFSKILIGRDPAHVEILWDEMRPMARNILGDRRIALHAQALSDILCWDLYAKSENKSMITLLGKKRTSASIIAIAGYYGPHKSLIDLAKETKNLIEIGCKGMKLKVGGLSVSEDFKRVKTVREAGGKDFLLAVDANQAWALDEALEFARACEHLDLLWIEEPVHWDNDIADLSKFRKMTDIPVCAGQSEVTLAGVARLIDSEAIDICNLHPGYAGGITPWLRSADLARENGLRVANTGEPQLSASLMLACEHGMSLEMYHPSRDPLFPKFCPAYRERINGEIKPTNLNGWGILPEQNELN
jgi:L-alanine-DL-glutamate epimerase-like enolase superfamily enzyme